MMRENKLKVLKGLIENPRGTDRGIAIKIGISQPTVTRTRHSLIDEKTVSFAAIPNLSQLGYKILAFSMIHEADGYIELKEELLKENGVLYLAKETEDLFVISAHRTIEDLRIFQAKYPETKSITLVISLIRSLQPLDFTKLLTSQNT